MVGDGGLRKLSSLDDGTHGDTRSFQGRDDSQARRVAKCLKQEGQRPRLDNRDRLIGCCFDRWCSLNSNLRKDQIYEYIYLYPYLHKLGRLSSAGTFVSGLAAQGERTRRSPESRVRLLAAHRKVTETRRARQESNLRPSA